MSGRATRQIEPLMLFAGSMLYLKALPYSYALVRIYDVAVDI